MSRSVRKGPFVDEHLLKKVRALGAAGSRTVIRPGPVALPSRQRWSARPSPCTTARSSFRSTFPRTWSATSSGEFAPTRIFKGHTTKVAEKATAVH